MELERKVFRFDIKSADDDSEGPDFKGNLSVAGVKDLQEDIVDQGAFTRTIKHHKGMFPMLIDHDHRNRLGVLGAAEEGKNLRIEGFVNKAKQMALDTLSDIKFNLAHKVPLGLSIGFQTVKEDIIDGVRHLKEIHLWEGSVVTFPANPKALITGAKRALVEFQDYPIASTDHGWDPVAAEKRVLAWAGGEDGLKTAEIQKQYRECFVWYETEKPSEFTSYKLLIADVIDGNLVAVPRALLAAAKALGGVDIPYGELPKAQAHLERYFQKMGLGSPFEKGGHFVIDTHSVLTYVESLKSLAGDVPDVLRGMLEDTGKALNALLAPTDAEIDALVKHSIYEYASEANGLSDADQILVDQHTAWVKNLRNDLTA